MHMKARSFLRATLLPLCLLTGQAWSGGEQEVLVKLRPGRQADFVASLAADVQIQRSHHLSIGDYVVLKGSPSNREDWLQKLRLHPSVAQAEPNSTWWVQGEKVAEVELFSDEYFSMLWGMVNTGGNEPDDTGVLSMEVGVPGADIGALEAWRVTRGSRKVVIAVVDSGVDYTHPDLVDNIWTNPGEIPGNGIDDDKNGYVDDVHGWNFYSGTADPMDRTGHGTHCAGTIGASHENGGVKGVMAEVQIMPVRFIGSNGGGSTDAAVAAVDYAVRMGADIISASWGGGDFSFALKDAINAAAKKGILFVAAAGNKGTDNDAITHYPDGYDLPNIIAVASHTHRDTLASSSHFGKKSVDIAAPGKNILSTIPGGKFAVYSGTSMATPHVSGALGLLLSRAGRLSLSQVKERLRETSEPGEVYRRTTAAGGRLNAANLVNNNRSPRIRPVTGPWVPVDLPATVESTHPYRAYTTVSNTVQVPGAKYLRVVVDKLDTEKNYDFLNLWDANGSIVQKLTGNGTSLTSEYAEGESLTLEFKSDKGINGWGFRIKRVEAIY